MTLHDLNDLSNEQRKIELTKCCGASAWVDAMNASFPFHNEEVLLQKADEVWKALSNQDWLKAFTHHPKIGDVSSLKEKFAATAKWASGEQSSVQAASEQTLHDLAYGNRAYEEKFGFIFIVFATGKSADQMLQLLNERLPNNREEEIKKRGGGTSKDYKVATEKIVNMSQITTHILDTSKGKPASGVDVLLYQQINDDWQQIAKGQTNADGRIANLLQSDVQLAKGIYKLRFDTAPYFSAQHIQTFYPFVEIVFDIQTPEHYHVPLLLNPFGYSTYRGS